MKRSTVRRETKSTTFTGLVILCALFISAAAAPAIAYDYAAEVNQTCAWLVTQQITSGGNLGGIQEAENMSTTVESDNTQEAVYMWSRYAELTGDYTTYQTNINNAWTYLNNFPAWNENGTPTNYYNTYNCGWGMLAEMKYRQVYQSKAGYVDHTAYGRHCASFLVGNNCGKSNATNACCLGLAAGALYKYGVFDANASARATAVTLGNDVKTWLGTSNFSSEGWAVSAGVAVWGVMNSYFKDPNHSAEAPAWAVNADANMPSNPTDTGDGYLNGHTGWYAWGHYALSEVRGSNSFTKYQNLIDTLLSRDGDNDGGIPQQGSTAADYAWTTDIMQTASNMGLVGMKYTISGTITSGGSALAGVQMSGLPGVPVTDANGNYTATVTSGWIGTVTPIKTGYTFSPATITYTAVTSNQTAQNYTVAGTPPGQASAPSPSTGATGVDVNVILSWTAGSGATSHDVYFGTAATPPFVQNQAGTSYDPPGALNAGTTYYWRIDEKNAGGTTTGTVWSFTTLALPGQASAPSPSTGATGVDVNVILSWTAGSGATSHDVYFGTAATPPFVQNQTGTTYDPPGALNPGITYYWRINEKNGSGVTTGTLWSFTTLALPGQASAPSPSTGATGVDVNVILSWTAGARATSHDVYFGTASTPPFVQNQTGTTYDPPGALNPGITYYWRINEKNGSGVTTGTVWNFTTLALPAQASAPSPSTGATAVDVNVVLGWTAGARATSHDVYFGTASTPPFVQNQAGTTYDPPGALAAGVQYYWRIDERNGSGVTTGTVWNFTTLALPAQASAPSPSTGATAVDVNVILSWTAGARATSHDVYFGTASTPPFVQNQAGTTYDPPGALANGTTYYWQINERNGSGSTAGPLWSFTTIYKRTLTSSSTDGGNVTTPGEGAFQYDHATVVNLVATADAHYHFVNWTGTAVTAGKVASPTSASTTVQMDADYTVIANFAIDTFTLTYTAGDNGTISGTSPQTVDYNTNGAAVTAVANTGYHFVKWSDDKTAR
ncbi:MAG: hypothetical protein ABSH16_09470 [Sedimentisphaerales bacterium]